jgi:hypothetical protein
MNGKRVRWVVLVGLAMFFDPLRALAFDPLLAERNIERAPVAHVVGSTLVDPEQSCGARAVSL